MTFKKGESGNPAGRPKKIYKELPENLIETSLEVILDAIQKGDTDCACWVLERVFPKLKPITPPDSLEGEEVELRVIPKREFRQNKLDERARLEESRRRIRELQSDDDRDD